MTDKNGEDKEEEIDIKVELSGKYDEVMSKLGREERLEFGGLSPVIEDITAILQAVIDTEGAIKSKIARRADVGLSDNQVRNVLDFLKEYDLVELDGNTWKPGPALSK